MLKIELIVVSIFYLIYIIVYNADNILGTRFISDHKRNIINQMFSVYFEIFMLRGAMYMVLHSFGLLK